MRIGKIRLVRIIASLVVIITGAATKTYVDNNKHELSVDEVVQVINSKGVNHGGFLHVTGSLKNISDIDNVKVKMKVSFMDSNQNSMKSVETVNDDLDAGEVWNFDVVSLGKNASYYSIDYIEIECE